MAFPASASSSNPLSVIDFDSVSNIRANPIAYNTPWGNYPATIFQNLTYSYVQRYGSRFIGADSSLGAPFFNSSALVWSQQFRTNLPSGVDPAHAVAFPTSLSFDVPFSNASVPVSRSVTYLYCFAIKCSFYSYDSSIPAPNSGDFDISAYVNYYSSVNSSYLSYPVRSVRNGEWLYFFFDTHLSPLTASVSKIHFDILVPNTGYRYDFLVSVSPLSYQVFHTFSNVTPAPAPSGAVSYIESAGDFIGILFNCVPVVICFSVFSILILFLILWKVIS